MTGGTQQVPWSDLSPSLESPEIRTFLYMVAPGIPEPINYWAMILGNP